MDIFETVKNNGGALAVGALWMLYVIGDKVWKDAQERKKTKETDKAEGSLIGNLAEALKNAQERGLNDRTRADDYAIKYADLSAEVGTLRAKLEFAEKRAERAEEEVEELRDTVETLVIENRNKDKSINQLVDLNRKLLRSMGTTPPPVLNESD